MSETPPPAANSRDDKSNDDKSNDYVVIARRYRPQTFDELIGQQHVSQALSRAIASERVGHAYLFTSARGVGKTSAARILAKALNCAEGTSPTPCNQCEICTSVGSGDDIDVLLSATYFEASKPKLIAERTGCTVVRVRLEPGDGQSYFDLVDSWVDELARAFGEKD